MNLELWRTNSKIPDNLVDSHVSEIKKSVLPFRNMWSTFELLGKKKSPDLIFAEYYESILDVVVSDFGIKSRVDKLSFNYWTQVYGNKARHSEHDHLSGATLFSWVHFIRPTKEKCFCFLDDERRPYFPEQNAGDFIVFPEWALHTVKPNTSGEERVVNYNIIPRNLHRQSLVLPAASVKGVKNEKTIISVSGQSDRISFGKDEKKLRLTVAE